MSIFARLKRWTWSARTPKVPYDPYTAWHRQELHLPVTQPVCLCQQQLEAFYSGQEDASPLPITITDLEVEMERVSQLASEMGVAHLFILQRQPTELALAYKITPDVHPRILAALVDVS